VAVAELRPSLVARVPIKKWNGRPTVKADIQVGGVTLTGQFALDAETTLSVFSPEFTLAQGIDSRHLVAPGSKPLRVSTILGESATARIAAVHQGRVGGMPLPWRVWLIMETEIFSPPQTTRVCCDGILGANFFDAYVIEFIPEGPAIELHDRDRFVPDAGFTLVTGEPLRILWDRPERIAEGQIDDRIDSTSSELASVRKRGVPALRFGAGFPLQHAVAIDRKGRRFWVKNFPEVRTLLAASAELSEGSWIEMDYASSGAALDREARYRPTLQAARTRLAAFLRTRGIVSGDVLEKVGGKSTAEMDQWDIESSLSESAMSVASPLQLSFRKGRGSQITVTYDPVGVESGKKTRSNAQKGSGHTAVGRRRMTALKRPS